MQRLLVSVIFALCLITSFGQDQFTEQDSLRGSITPERAWWDLIYYHLDVEVKPDDKFISGSTTIRYKVLEEHKVLQVDLQPPLKIENVTQNGKSLKVDSNGNAHFIHLKKNQQKGDINQVVIAYSGKPREAVRAPWDGGFSWKKDENDKHFIATSCQGLGASVWWPNKDHMYDEVDSMDISVTVPNDLVGVANGRLKKVDKNEGTSTYHWFVTNPINNYGVNVNIGDYVHFGESFEGEKGNLDLDYWVLRDNLEKAKKQFVQVPMLLQAFEYWFGPYPFYEDSFKLVEVPYLGMEHQSSITYGNKYANGYLGRDLSKSGWGLEFDYIIIHEAGHEWFANNITYKDIADMWVHEGFTSYSENLYVDYHYGKEAGSEYVIGLRGNIRNDKPIIGPYNVNKRGSGDMYAKGANILHTLRQLIEDDALWRDILRGLNSTFYHQTVTTKQVEDYISEKTSKDLSAFFNQYLRTAKVPVLEYELIDEGIKFRYTNIVNEFDMPIQVQINEISKWLYPSSDWKTEKTDSAIESFSVDPNFYIDSKKL